MQEKCLSYTMLSEDRNPIWQSSTCHTNPITTHHVSAWKSLLEEQQTQLSGLITTMHTCCVRSMFMKETHTRHSLVFSLQVYTVK